MKPRALGIPSLAVLTPAQEGRPTPEILAAYAECKRLTRKSGSSFTSAFWMLPRVKRRALHAIYAFCRLSDDIADDPCVAGDRAKLLGRWRDELEAAYRGRAEHLVGVALGDAARRFQLPQREFSDLLLGVEFDLRGDPVETWEDLERYCDRVASTVGRLVVRVLGYRNPRTLEYARTLGIAVQLTNVLRDVGEDAAEGRIYLAGEDLERFGVHPDALRERRASDALRLLLACYAERARLHYERAAQLLPEEDRAALRPAEAMGRIYRVLLDELQRKGFGSLDQTLRLSRRRRLAIAARVWLGFGARA
ncbi:MAG: presqualene diphosphate synthase HpnD [Myxococcales bacterium]|nr:presqualene diphosphate synthase HpnD [Myxococcales bacterium]